MITFLLTHPITVIAALVCALAWLKGDAVERSASLLVGGAWVVSILAQIFCSRAWFEQATVVEPYLIAAVDAAVGAGFVILTLRHPKRWLGVAILVQSAQLALDAAFLTGDGLNSLPYVMAVNLLSLGTVLLLLWGTAEAWMRRARFQRPPPPLTVASA